MLAHCLLQLVVDPRSRLGPCGGRQPVGGDESRQSS